MGGLTKDGWSRSNLTELLAETEKDLQDAYQNPNISLEDDGNLGVLVKTLVNRENKVWQALEAADNARTMNGAEGEFLDEIYAKQGIFREGKTAGNGNAIVITGKNAVDFTVIPVGSLFSADNGAQYVLEDEYLVFEYVIAYRLEGDELENLGNYAFDMIDRVTGIRTQFSVTLNNLSDSSKLIFMRSLRDNLATALPDEEYLILDEDNLILRFGLNTFDVPIGLSHTLTFRMNNTIGKRYTEVPVKCTTKGYLPLLQGGITGMSPPIDGLEGATNNTTFFSGTDIETDAAFISRVRRSTNTATSATRDAIVAAVLRNVPEVRDMQIKKEVVGGVVNIYPVVIGGTDAEIAKAIYDSQGIDCNMLGSFSYPISTADGDSEIIRFSRGVDKPLSVRVRFVTVDGTPLSTSEKQSATDSLVNLGSSWGIGDTIFNAQFSAAIFGTIAFNRFKQLIVETKDKSFPPESFNSDNVECNFTELATLISEDIQFVQEVI